MSLSPIMKALAMGYAAPQVLQFVAHAFPSLASRIQKAQSTGYSVEKILKMLNRGMGGGDELDNLTESQIHTRRDAQQNQLGQDFAKAGLGAGASFAAIKALPGIAQGIRGALGGGRQPPPIPTIPSPQPGIGPQPMAGAPVQPPPIPPVGPTPGNTSPPNNVPPAPITPPTTPAQPTAKPWDNLSPDRSVEILKEMGLEQRIKNLTDAGNSPEVVADALNAGLTAGQRKWFGEKLKAGETKPLQDLVKDYLSTQPTGEGSLQVQNAKEEIPTPEIRPMLEPSGQKLDEATKATQGTPEITPEYQGESLDERAKYLRRIDEEDTHLGKQEKERLDHIDYWEKWLKEHTKNRENPLKSTKDFIREAKSQQKVIGTHYAKGHDKETQREMHDSLQRYIDHLSELDAHEESDKLARKNLKKGDLVFDQETGKTGQIKDIKTQQGLIDSDGKTEKVKVDELIPTSENLIEAAQNLLKIPEVDRSSIISLATYRPKSKQLFIQYHNGETYIYEDVKDEVVQSIGEAMGIPVTSGKNMFGAWDQGKQDSRGAALIHNLLRDPKYGKDQEGITWEKIGTIYDYWQKLRKVPKRKKK